MHLRSISGGLIEFNGCARDSFDDGDKVFGACSIKAVLKKSAYSMKNNVLGLIFECSEWKKGGLKHPGACDHGSCAMHFRRDNAYINGSFIHILEHIAEKTRRDPLNTLYFKS